jgi:2-octaprenyl-6-methoxyphenol hydroxylase
MASPTDRTFDVVIAGGSYAGLALALALARTFGAGLSVAVVEQRPLADADAGAPVSADPRAFALAAGSRHLLEAVGVWAGLADFAEPVVAIDITDSRLEDAVRPVLLSYDNVVGGIPQTHIVQAARLEAGLLQAVRAEPRVCLMAPAEIAGLEPNPSGIRLKLADGRSVAGRLAVAADGAGSVLRKAAGIGVASRSYGQVGIVTIVGHEAEHGGRAVQHFLPGGPFALLPLSGRRSCITWSEEEMRGRAIVAGDDASFLAEAQRRAGWSLGALSLAGPRALWPLSLRLARSLTAPRLALIGDAARSVHPIAGQGVNLGLRDVAALVEVLAESLRLGLEAGDQTILDRYARWRRFDGVQSAAAYSALNALFSNDWTLLRGIRDAGLGAVERLSGLKHLLVTEAAGRTGEVPRLLRGELP